VITPVHLVEDGVHSWLETTDFRYDIDVEHASVLCHALLRDYAKLVCEYEHKWTVSYVVHM